MANIWGITKEAFDLFQNARETCAFFLFILEESIQACNMGVYLLYKAELHQDAIELIEWTSENLVKPLKDISQGVGVIAFPMNIAFTKFAEASEKTLESYKKAILK